MWEFRRRPEDLSPEERANLEALFTTLPRLRALYEIRLCFQRIFDTARTRQQALYRLTGLWLDILEGFPEMEAFICTFEAWQD